MVDTQSYLRKTRVGPCSVEVRQSFPSYALINSEFAHRVFSTEHPEGHSCRQQSYKERSDPQHWPAFLLTFGLKETHEDVTALHYKEVKHRKIQEKPKDKLLYSVGQRGSKEGYFCYPRGLGIGEGGDIVVADTENHRVQVLNSAGVLKYVIGKGRGSKPGELLYPTDACWMPTGNYAVADQGNARVQLFRPKGTLRMMFLTLHKPHAITCDFKHNLLVTTVSRTVEIYKKGGKLGYSFPIGGNSAAFFVSIAANGNSIYICDTPTKSVRIFDYQGHAQYVFDPVGSRNGLGMLPVGIDVTATGQVVIGDALNHTVNVYSKTGKLEQQALCPTDDLGSVQAVKASPEGHLVVTEYTSNGLHCVKIFRFDNCHCHASRPASARSGKSTPIPRTHYLTEQVVTTE